MYETQRMVDAICSGLAGFRRGWVRVNHLVILGCIRAHERIKNVVCRNVWVWLFNMTD